MNATELDKGYYKFGNKGAVWSDKVHIAKSGEFSGTTLCGTPMLSRNWAQITEHQTVKCPECLKNYKEKL